MAEQITDTYKATLERNNVVQADLLKNPQNYRVLTGDRPTGLLHIGHLFGSLQNRVRVQNLGVKTFIVIADYQVLTDREMFEHIAENIRELTIDYIACGLDPENGNTFIFPHSQVPELNQLLLPFLTLVSSAELERNPTVKEEIQSAQLKSVNAGMLVYPVHQAADILFCKGNLVPVGKDQLPHLQISRLIARRFNEKYAGGKSIFPAPDALLSETPLILGLDGGQKMSKSRGNAILLSSTEDETAALIKKAKTDSQRHITFDVENRPEVSNLLTLISLCTGEDPVSVAEKIGDGGAGELKRRLTEALNEFLRPHRQKRLELEKNPDYIHSVLVRGVEHAREIAQRTLEEVRTAMNMII